METINSCIVKAVTELCERVIKNDPNNYLIISDVDNTVSIGLLLKKEDELLVLETYVNVDGVMKDKKLSINTVIYSTFVNYPTIKNDFIDRMSEMARNFIIDTSNFFRKNAEKITEEILNGEYTRFKINCTFAQKHSNTNTNTNKHKTLTKSTSIADAPKVVAELICDNDNVQLSFLTNNSYLEENIIINLYLEKRTSVSGIEMVHISETRVMDNKNVLLYEDSFDDIYAESSMCNIKDSMKNEEFKKIIVYVIEDCINHIIDFMNKIGDKGSKKYKIYTF